MSDAYQPKTSGRRIRTLLTTGSRQRRRSGHRPLPERRQPVPVRRHRHTPYCHLFPLTGSAPMAGPPSTLAGRTRTWPEIESRPPAGTHPTDKGLGQSCPATKTSLGTDHDTAATAPSRPLTDKPDRALPRFLQSKSWAATAMTNGNWTGTGSTPDTRYDRDQDFSPKPMSRKN